MNGKPVAAGKSSFDLIDNDQKSAIQEVSRLVKPGGILNIIEFKKIDEGPGPPENIRLGEREIDDLITPYGFEKLIYNEIAEFNYLVQYKKIHINRLTQLRKLSRGGLVALQIPTMRKNISSP